MKIEGKVHEPINIRISKDCNEVMADKNHPQSYPLDPGVMIGGEHYGFIIIRDTKRGQKEEVYPTQCKVVGVCIEDDVLKIMEEGKYHPWRFSKQGEFITHAVFAKNLRDNRQYLADNFGGYTDEDMEKANVLIKR